MKKPPDYLTLILAILLFIGAFIIVKLNIESSETKNNLADCEKELSLARNDNHELHNKNVQLEIELNDCKSKIKTLTENNDKLSERVFEYHNIMEVQNDLNSNCVSNKWYIGQSLPLPDIPSNMKLCTDFRHYNIKGTPHNRLQQAAWTDEYGCRRYNNDYIVALGSYYSVNIGDRFEVTLDTGRVLTVILGDGKADCDTDELNMFTPCFNYDGEYCANILEFIVDDTIMYQECYQYGSLDYHDEFKGNIVKMVYLGRDNGGDWTSYE